MKRHLGVALVAILVAANAVNQTALSFPEDRAAVEREGKCYNLPAGIASVRLLLYSEVVYRKVVVG